MLNLTCTNRFQSLKDVILNEGVDDDKFKSKKIFIFFVFGLVKYCHILSSRYRVSCMVLSFIKSAYFLSYVFVKIHVFGMSYLSSWTYSHLSSSAKPHFYVFFVVHGHTPLVFGLSFFIISKKGFRLYHSSPLGLVFSV